MLSSRDSRGTVITNWMMSELYDVVYQRRYMLSYDSRLTKNIDLLLRKKLIIMLLPETPRAKVFVPTFKGLWVHYLWESTLVPKDSQIFK